MGLGVDLVVFHLQFGVTSLVVLVEVKRRGPVMVLILQKTSCHSPKLCFLSLSQSAAVVFQAPEISPEYSPVCLQQELVSSGLGNRSCLKSATQR